MMGGPSPDRRRFDDEHADEAARFLDRELVGHEDRVGMVQDLIAGIDRLERVRAWKAAERALSRANGDPRRSVIQLLEEREATLREIGDRVERLPYGPREPCDCCDPEARAELLAELARQREQRHRQNTGAWTPTGAVDEDSTDDAGEEASLDQFAVATDGGEQA